MEEGLRIVLVAHPPSSTNAAQQTIRKIMAASVVPYSLRRHARAPATAVRAVRFTSRQSHRCQCGDQKHRAILECGQFNALSARTGADGWRLLWRRMVRVFLLPGHARRAAQTAQRSAAKCLHGPSDSGLQSMPP